MLYLQSNWGCCHRATEIRNTRGEGVKAGKAPESSLWQRKFSSSLFASPNISASTSWRYVCVLFVPREIFSIKKKIQCRNDNIHKGFPVFFTYICCDTWQIFYFVHDANISEWHSTRYCRDWIFAGSISGSVNIRIWGGIMSACGKRNRVIYQIYEVWYIEYSLDGVGIVVRQYIFWIYINIFIYWALYWWHIIHLQKTLTSHIYITHILCDISIFFQFHIPANVFCYHFVKL